MTITAEAHTDCYTAEVKFDAVRWFEQAADAEIIALSECGWGGDIPSDGVALSEEAHNAEVADFFTVHRVLRRKNPDIGFECYVSDAEARAWVAVNRPALVAQLGED